MSSKITYFPEEMIDTVSWLDVKNTTKPESGLISGISNSDFKLSGIMKILFVLQKEDLKFGKVLSSSGFRMKKSFLAYIHLMQKLDLIIKMDGNREAKYQITDRGTTILRMLS